MQHAKDSSLAFYSRHDINLNFVAIKWIDDWVLTINLTSSFSVEKLPEEQ